MKSWMHYIVEKKDGEVRWYTALRGALLRRRHPYAEKGLVKLGSGSYAVNPQYFRRRMKRKWRVLPWPLEEHVYVYYAEGIPTEMPFFRTFPQVKEMEENAAYSAFTVSQAQASKLASEFLNPSTNWMMIFFALIAGMGLGAVLMNVVERLG